MKYASYLPLLLISGLLSQASCRGEPIAPIAPSTSEVLPVSVQTRSPVPGEPVPAVHVSGGPGNMTVQVTTVAMCATVVSAGISRAPYDVAVVSNVSANPAALCVAAVSPYVVDYQGTIMSLSEGSYRVRVFESRAVEPPRLIGSAIVTVSRPAA